MRRVFLLSAAVLAGHALTAGAQNPGGIKLSDVAGSWEGKSMIGPKDSVVVTYVMTVTADGKGGTLKFPKGDAIPTRIIAVGGDSIVTEVGPYPSVLRPGQTVARLRMIGHVNGNTMTGPFMARYESGGVVRGKSAATRKQ